MLALVHTTVCIYALLFIRLHIAGKLRLWAIEQIGEINKARIYARTTKEQLNQLTFTPYMLPPFMHSVLDLTLWTREQARRKLIPTAL